MPYDNVNHITEDRFRDHIGLTYATGTDIEVHYRDGKVKHW